MATEEDLRRFLMEVVTFPGEMPPRMNEMIICFAQLTQCYAGLRGTMHARTDLVDTIEYKLKGLLVMTAVCVFNAQQIRMPSYGGVNATGV
jgi:hypothetical protein